MLIGIDVGTTAVKAALFDEHGHSLRQFNRVYPTLRPAIGHVQQNPKDWIDLVLQALAELSDGVAISAIGICSQVNTHVFVDHQGAPLMPAMTWQDTRCASDAHRIDALITADDKITWWGAPLPIDASHVLARIAYMARVEPEIWKCTAYVLAPKDYCLFHLVGKAIADPMTNFGILDQNLKLIDPLFDLVPGARERMPILTRFTDIAGTIRTGLPCAGVPIVTGAMDAWAGLLGAGVSRDGQGLYLSGTSEILGLVSHERHPAPGVIAFAECEGITLHAGPTQSGGASAQWAARLLNLDITEFFSIAKYANPKYVPLFLPHLDGERAPLWDSNAKGSFTGLTSQTGAAELARSVMEGVAYSARLVFDSLEKSAGLKAGIVLYSGGGSRSDLWSQIRSDVLETPLRRTATRDAGVLGAALIAAVGTNLFRSLPEAAESFVLYDQLFEPRLVSDSYHRDHYHAFKLAYDQLKPLNLIQH